jgi:hypothetical protein
MMTLKILYTLLALGLAARAFGTETIQPPSGITIKALGPAEVPSGAPEGSRILVYVDGDVDLTCSRGTFRFEGFRKGKRGVGCYEMIEEQ